MNMSSLGYDQIQFLLDQIGVIDDQYKKSKKRDNFNVFNILKKKFDEVDLHSRFLYELISPTGSHGCEKLFLTALLTRLGVPDFNFNKVKVYREHHKIDILITNDKQAIVIENKLWAIDQPGQLQRYYELLIRDGFRDIKLFYLSLDGKEPEEHSIGNLIELSNWKSIFSAISYDIEIEKWLEDCIKEAYAKPTLRETLVQYRSLIREITGKTMLKEEMDEMVDFIAKGDNILKAKKIEENWKHVRLKTELRFWHDLETTISLKYEILPLQKYSSTKINDVINRRRTQNFWYGIMFKIGKHLKADACIFIERGDGSEPVYYGLTMVIGETKEHSGSAKFKPITDKIVEFSEWHHVPHWIGGNFCKPEINFTEFSSEDTLRLLNDDFRYHYIKNLWNQIQEFTDKAVALL